MFTEAHPLHSYVLTSSFDHQRHGRDVRPPSGPQVIDVTQKHPLLAFSQIHHQRLDVRLPVVLLVQLTGREAV